MKFTKDQQELVRNIESNKILNIVDYIQQFQYKSIDSEMTILSDEDRIDFFNKLTTFEFLIKKLSNHELIYKVQNTNEVKTNYHTYNISRHPIDDFRINGIIKANLDYNIFPTLELKDFIENNFQTKDEISLDEEKKDRDRNYKLTKTLALSSIFISLFLSSFSIIFQYLTYSNERKVFIMNESKIDSIRVYGKIKIDSLSILNNSLNSSIK